MNKTEANPLLPPSEAALSQLLHDFNNQLGGLKLYAAFLKKSLENKTLDRHEGIEICEKILQQIDNLTVRTKETARVIQTNPS